MTDYFKSLNDLNRNLRNNSSTTPSTLELEAERLSAAMPRRSELIDQIKSYSIQSSYGISRAQVKIVGYVNKQSN